MRIERSLSRGLRSGKLTERECAAALDHITYTIDLDDFADRELVLAAVAEDEQVKADVFGILDKVVESRDAIFASNTSSIPIMRLAMATQRPQQVIGIHFVNPVPVLRLVEIIPSLFTDEDTETRAEAFVAGVLGKTAIRASDRAGFIVNGLLIPYICSPRPGCSQEDRLRLPRLHRLTARRGSSRRCGSGRVRRRGPSRAARAG